MNINLQPIDFKLNDYINKSMELFKKDFGNFLLAYIFCVIMSFIPFCSLLAMGNFYKYCRKVHRGEPANPSEIFNFDDFSAYIILQLIILGAIIAMYIPFLATIPFQNTNEEPSSVFGIFVVVYFLIAMIALIIIAIKAFYIPGLISLKGIKDLKTAWNMSKIMTKGNLWMIILFSIGVSFLSQLGFLLCGIGILLTMPFLYIAHYFAYEDALQQIDYDEIKEIGNV